MTSAKPRQKKSRDTIFVYSLTDPREPAVIRYVGVTANPQRRFRDHCTVSTKQDTYKGRWLLSLIRDDIFPIMDIIETTNENGWVEAEKRWIRHYRALDMPLTNGTEGGVACFGLSEDSRSKRRANIKTYWESLSNAEKAAVLSQFNSPEAKARRRGLVQAYWASRTPEQEADRVGRMLANRKPLTPEQKEIKEKKRAETRLQRKYAPLSEDARKARAEATRTYRMSLPPEERLRQAKHAAEMKKLLPSRETPDQQQARIMKSLETKRSRIYEAYHHSEATKAILRQKAQERVRTQTTEQRRAWQLQKPYTDEQRAKAAERARIREADMTPEQRAIKSAKCSLANKKRYLKSSKAVSPNP